MILPSSNNILPSGPNNTGPQSSITKLPNVSSTDLSVVSSTPSVNVNLSSSRGAQTAAIATIPPIYSKPTVYASNESQLSPSKGAGSSETLAENTVSSKPSDSTSEQVKDKEPKESASNVFELSEDELKMVEELKARDLEVRAHEQAHKSVGGQYTGAISFSYQAGPDGKRYAVGGEVPIDVSPVVGDPQATIIKMTVVSAAATAPAQPSAQDQMVAAQAARAISEAQAELAQKKYDDLGGRDEMQKGEKKSDPISKTDSFYIINSLDKFQSISQKSNEKVNLVDTIV
tara:strand:- start:239 stop:1102 length:864 start_codon:yes stop_codon:yes gene_type:complete